jgi:hypothetical protein
LVHGGTEKRWKVPNFIGIASLAASGGEIVWIHGS